MDEKSPRAPGDRGQGRKPKAASGHVMRNRIVRMTDSEWAACEELGGPGGRSDWIRAAIAKGIKALRRRQD